MKCLNNCFIFLFFSDISRKVYRLFRHRYYQFFPINQTPLECVCGTINGQLDGTESYRFSVVLLTDVIVYADAINVCRRLFFFFDRTLGGVFCSFFLFTVPYTRPPPLLLYAANALYYFRD